MKPDTEPDIRGMAIKLMNVDGDKVLDDEEKTQDFILINHHVFFLPDVQGYIDFSTFRQMQMKAQGDNPPPELEEELQKLEKKLHKSLAIIGEINRKIVGNPLLIKYWSTTPYKLGCHQIKFSAKPNHIEQSPTVKPDSPNYLREAIVSYFNKFPCR